MKNNTSSGFTVIELMVAVVISSILMLGVIQIFIANSQSNKTNTGLSRVQENIRFALKDISSAGRMAGYKGCSDNIQNHLDTTDPGYDDDLFNFDNATGGWEFTNGSATSITRPGGSYTLGTVTPSTTASNWDDTAGDDLPATLVNHVLPGSDVLVLKWAGANTGVSIKNMNINNASINTNNASGIGKGTILIVSDCSGGDAFMNVANPSAKALSRGTASGWSPGNVNPGSSDWSHVFPEASEILFFTSRAFYVGQGASGEPALYRITYTQGATAQVREEIAEGVENMQVLYGYDTDGDDYANQFVTAQDLPDHASVVAVKLAFLARSNEELKDTASSRTFDLLGTDITSPSDRRLRYSFSTTIKLRNKGVK
ncbi:MAG: PilW family protein [Pseudomonadota bacterium]|nr:PilW family protein [Pseudomonadota bacterium]